MTLLKFADIATSDEHIRPLSEAEGGFVLPADLSPEFILGKGSVAVAEKFGKLEANKFYSYMSNGDWSMYHIVNHFIQQTGPEDIFIATWSISEFSARQLTDWLSTGRIKSVSALVDTHSQNRHASAFHLAKHSFSKIKVAFCHAKVTVIRSDSHYISINGSANWTENPRIETGVITTDKNTAERHIKWINEMIEKSQYELD